MPNHPAGLEVAFNVRRSGRGHRRRRLRSPARPAFSSGWNRCQTWIISGQICRSTRTSAAPATLGQADRVVEQGLAGADLDQQRREAGEVGVERRRQRRARIGAAKIQLRHVEEAGASAPSGRLRFRLVIDPPAASMSTQGEMHQPQPGCGSPASRIATIAATTRPPPALSPAIAMRPGLNPRASRKR